MSSVNQGDANDPKDKRLTFERYLTYRRRMSRLCAVQAIYMLDMNLDSEGRDFSEFDFKPGSEDLESIFSDLSNSVLYFYKNIFFVDDFSDPNKKNKKIDEKYLLEIIQQVLVNIKSVDDMISKFLKETWTIERLDFVVRSILRCSVAEIIYNVKTDTPILTSEYTNLASNFFNGKQIGFVNGVIDNIAKLHRNNIK